MGHDLHKRKSACGYSRKQWIADSRRLEYEKAKRTIRSPKVGQFFGGVLLILFGLCVAVLFIVALTPIV